MSLASAILRRIFPSLNPTGIDVPGPDQSTIASLSTGFTEDTQPADSLTFPTTLPMSGPTQDYEFGGSLSLGNDTQNVTFEPNGNANNMNGQEVGGDGNAPYSEGSGSGAAYCTLGDPGPNSNLTFFGRAVQRGGYRFIVIHTKMTIGAAVYSQMSICKQSNAVEWTGARLATTAGSAAQGILAGSTFWMKRV